VRWPWVVLVVLVIILGGIIYHKYIRLPCKPFTNSQNTTITSLLSDILRCAKSSGVSSELIAGLEQMETGGVLTNAGDADANAITRGKCTCFAPFFFEGKSRCEQLLTLLWESMRVSGNMVEDTDPDPYERAKLRIAKEFRKMACCLSCCNDLPPELAPISTSPTGCCP